jgi:hypothetical protein
MKDIGYYAGFLSPDDQEEINKASKAAILDLMTDLALSMNGDQPFQPIEIEHFWLHGENSDTRKLALIRGLCDRIELKLMEAAK